MSTTVPKVVSWMGEISVEPGAPSVESSQTNESVHDIVNVDNQEGVARSVTLIGSPLAMLWQKVATAEL